jgi:hypothetical protein
MNISGSGCLVSKTAAVPLRTRIRLCTGLRGIVKRGRPDDKIILMDTAEPSIRPRQGSRCTRLQRFPGTTMIPIPGSCQRNHRRADPYRFVAGTVAARSGSWDNPVWCRLSCVKIQTEACSAAVIILWAGTGAGHHFRAAPELHQ